MQSAVSEEKHDDLPHGLPLALSKAMSEIADGDHYLQILEV